MDSVAGTRGIVVKKGGGGQTALPSRVWILVGQREYKQDK